jgi:hypothetical protein
VNPVGVPSPRTSGCAPLHPRNPATDGNRCPDALQDDEKVLKYEEALRTQLAEELEAMKRDNAEASLAAAKAVVEDMCAAAADDMAKVWVLPCVAVCVGGGGIRISLACVPSPLGLGWAGVDGDEVGRRGVRDVMRPLSPCTH